MPPVPSTVTTLAVVADPGDAAVDNEAGRGGPVDN